MSKIFVLKDPMFRTWDVWIGLEDGSEPPDGLNFIIGCGPTRAEALQRAEADLTAALADLRAAAEAQP